MRGEEANWPVNWKFNCMPNEPHLKGSSLEKCGHCWNEKTEACRNLPVSR